MKRKLPVLTLLFWNDMLKKKKKTHTELFDQFKHLFK